MPLLVTLLLSLVFLFGVVLGYAGENKDGVEDATVSLAFGAMLAVALFDIVPEMIESIRAGETTVFSFILFTFLGVMILIALDRFVPEHGEGNLTHIGIMSTLAVALHNIVEGMSVYSLASTSLSSGFLLALGVALHNIPMGMLISGTMKKGKRTRMVVTVTLASLSTFLGGLVMFFLEKFISSSVVTVLSSVALGMVIYILFFELLGDIMRSRKKLFSLLWIMAGLTVVIVGGFFG